MASRPQSMMMPKQPMISQIDQPRAPQPYPTGQQQQRVPAQGFVQQPIQQQVVPMAPQNARRSSNDGDERPLSVLYQPGAQMMQQNKHPKSPGSTVSTTPRNSAPKPASSPSPLSSTAPRPQSKQQPAPVNKPAPASMEEAMNQFHSAKQDAQQKVRWKYNSNTRLINAMADVTVCLLTRAMAEGIHHRLEIRIYKKPVALEAGGYAVGEYRNASSDEPKKKVKDAAKDGDMEYIIITAGELLPGEAGRDRDTVQNWKNFFNCVNSWYLWWRYCLAVHKRIGWSVKLERSLLNMVDSRVLGFATITISGFV